ncbi:hypothetical protein GCM10027093_71600 [Paraburkholderia jirisanensis]
MFGMSRRNRCEMNKEKERHKELKQLELIFYVFSNSRFKRGVAIRVPRGGSRTHASVRCGAA